MFIRLRQVLQRGRGQEGAVAVEFAIVLPILLLLVAGIMDFGHYWYIGHVISDASREGARYGTRYTGVLPAAKSPTISNYVLVTSGYASRLPADSNPSVTPSGAAMSAGSLTSLAGLDLVVTATATKTWWVLGSLVPTLGPNKVLTVSTTMTAE